VQISTLLSIKTGGCPEDCAYCPQSAQYQTEVKAEKLMSLEAVLAEARAAKAGGAARFCMGAAWRSPKDRELEQVCAMVEGVKRMGLETCATLGMLTAPQALLLKQSGLDYYNHNLDTSPEFYGAIITTRTYRDRLDTLGHVRAAGINVCCGGIVGMGEDADDRASMITRADQLAGAGRGNAARDRRDARSDRIRAHDRGRAHHDAEIHGAALCRTRGYERRDAGVVLPRRRQLDLLRPQTPHYAQSRARPRHAPVRPAWPRANAGLMDLLFRARAANPESGFRCSSAGSAGLNASRELGGR
jgi:hypothetical protein